VVKWVTRYHIGLFFLTFFLIGLFINFALGEETITLTLTPAPANQTITVTTAPPTACIETVTVIRTVEAMVYTYTTQLKVTVGTYTTWATTFTVPIRVTSLREEWVIPPPPYWLVILAVAGFMVALVGMVIYGRRADYV